MDVNIRRFLLVHEFIFIVLFVNLYKRNLYRRKIKNRKKEKIHGCFSERTAPGISLYRSLTLEKCVVPVIIQDKVIDDNLKRQSKNRTLSTCRLLLLT